MAVTLRLYRHHLGPGAMDRRSTVVVLCYKSAMVELWERQQSEGSKAFTAFRLYCEMEEDRSYSKVAGKLGKSETLIGRWGRNHKWQERVAEYDNYVQRCRTERNIRERNRMADRHADQAKLMQQKCLEALNAIDGSKLRPADVARLFEVATKAEIRARGEPTEDQVASISVHIERQKQPRYAEAAEKTAQPE